jgi:hypothetical protein
LILEEERMTGIDELSGVDLATAIAEAKGWRLVECPTVECPKFEGVQCWHIQSLDVYRIVSSYRPDRSVELAWYLDGDEWRWSFEEDRHESKQFPEANAWLVRALVHTSQGVYVASAEIVRGRKSEAYATARCRAYLKAKGWNKQKRLVDQNGDVE